MRQASGHWSLRASEEHLQGERRALSTRLGLSELSSEPGSMLPQPHELDLQPFSIRSLPRARLESYTRRVAGASSRQHHRHHQQQQQQQQHLLELNRAPPPSSSEPEADEFHDCSMDLEENSTFSNMFDDLDLEGSEMFHHEDHPVGASGIAGGATSAAASSLIQPEIGGSSSSRSRGPIYDPVASTGNNSRAFSCKRKSYNMPPGGAPVAFHHNEGMMIGPGHQPGVEFSRRAALVLPPPTLGASSSRTSAALTEGPRPQKTRLSSDYSSEPVFPSPPSPRRDSSAISVAESQASSQAYPRAVRRAFPHGAEDFRARRAAMLDFPEIPSSESFSQLASGGSGSPGLAGTHLGSLRSPRSFHTAGGSTGVAGGSQGISRRIGRINSSRGLGSNPSLPSQPGESRTRSMRMAILENAPGVRREGGSNVLANAASRHLLHPGVGESRQGFSSGRSGGLFAGGGGGGGSGGGFVAPQIALMEPPELRAPPVFDGSQGSLRHPGLGMNRRELSEGFMAIPHEFDWEHHRPRFMAGGLAEILRALERVERDEDLTREQLMMLEATTFLFGGIGLHDDHSDWRLDIDNMSYEELLALGDRIGTVSTGLTEETIAQKLKKLTYSAALAQSTEDSDVKCCICQEEFEEEVQLGKIDCGHKYHTDCIGQWLLQKNSCPICKSTAL